MLFAFPLLALAAVQAPAPTAQPTANTQAPAREKVICKVDDEDTYSRIRKRVCKTESEWKRPKEPHSSK